MPQGTAVFEADDMIDFVRKAGAFLRDQAVFAAAMRALDHQAATGAVYLTGHWSGSAGRALWPCGGYVPDP
jgi:hypothetical protein